MRSLHEETATKDLTIAELRLQVAELQPAQQEVLVLRRQLELLDERIRGRDSETHARVGEMSAKLELHESVEEQLERQLLRGEEERLQLSEQLIAAERLRIEAQGQMQQAPPQAAAGIVLGKDKGWMEMSHQEQAAAQVIGYDGTRWDEGDVPVMCEVAWEQLGQREQVAATLLGYTASSWEEERDEEEDMAAAA